ncbi:MAG: PHP domain-containing protein [Bacteroidota bacterium]
MTDFTHLHLHTNFSILDGASKIDVLMKKVADSGMNAVAITDHGNMYGVMHFTKAAKAHGVKPLIGCEVYVTESSRHNKRGKQDRSGHHLILIAKNKKGYEKKMERDVANKAVLDLERKTKSTITRMKMKFR